MPTCAPSSRRPQETALALARTRSIRAASGSGSRGARRIAAAAELGFLARIDRTRKPSEETATREADGQISVAVPVEDGMAEVRFSANLDRDLTTLGALVALVAVGLAAALGTLFGRALGDDLVMATRAVRLLGTEDVMRGVPEIGNLARFELVSRMGRAIEVLAERFRVFAAAQERALDARENARRMRGLLFASVSHDLKSPLNAISAREMVSRGTLDAHARACTSSSPRQRVLQNRDHPRPARVEPGASSSPGPRWSRSCHRSVRSQEWPPTRPRGGVEVALVAAGAVDQGT